MGDQSVGGDLFFVLMGAILVFAMHGGFAFLEVGTVRRKNQVNALVKILVDFAISTTAYFLIGYTIAYGVGFFVPASELINGEGYGPQGLTLVKLFFLATFAAAVPAIISGGIAERMKFLPQCLATALLVAFLYPFFEGIAWGGNYGIQDWFETTLGARFNDFAGSIVVHAVGGWVALAPCSASGRGSAATIAAECGLPAVEHPVAGARLVAALHRLVRLQRHVRGLARRCHRPGRRQFADGHGRRHPRGGIVGRGDPGFVHNGALAGLVAVCAGSNIMHPAGASSSARSPA